jgi:hypothetical protein
VTLIQGILLGVGAVLEFVGIVVLAAPDLVPYRDRLSRWLTPRVLRAVNWLRRLVGLPPIRKVVTAGASVTAAASIRASGVSGHGPYATLEEKVSFLIDRDQQTQRAINTLSNSLRELEHSTSQRLERLDDELREQVTSEVTTAQDQHRPLRVLGALALAIGLVFTTVANFV